AQPELAPQVQKLKASLRSSRYHVRFSIATGRAFSGAEDFLNELALDRRMPVVLYNGGLVVIPQKRQALFQRLIPSEYPLEILRIGIAHRITVLFYLCGSDMTLQPDALTEAAYGWGDHDLYTVEFNGLKVAWQAKTELAKTLQPVAVLMDLRESPSRM